MRASQTVPRDAIAALRRVPPALVALGAPALAALAALAGPLACAGTGGAEPPLLGEAPPLPEGALRVRLVFAAEADLDLYVTGPAHETVYFANASASDGGQLEADRRCDAPEPRVETVVFPQPRPGTYRVGVDFMVRCDGADETPYRLVVEAPGREPLERRGVARFGVFEPRVLEVRVSGGAP